MTENTRTGTGQTQRHATGGRADALARFAELYGIDPDCEVHGSHRRSLADCLTDPDSIRRYVVLRLFVPDPDPHGPAGDSIQSYLELEPENGTRWWESDPEYEIQASAAPALVAVADLDRGKELWRMPSDWTWIDLPD